MDYGLDYWDHKSVRDPLYGFIHLSKRETALISTPYIHRLTRIKQLAHSYLVYPSAVHTRFEHSLGILHIADRMCCAYKIDQKRREIIRAAALLHDVGHGPFSHLFEDVMVKINGKNFSHEKITKAIIEYDPKISEILKGTLPGQQETKLEDLYSNVLAIFGEQNPSSDQIAKSIISSQIDADKMDYLRRDSYHTGSTYGIFDLERILSTLRLGEEVQGKPIPVILEKGIPALETFRLARYSIYTQVYQHHARLIADQMFLRSLELAVFKEKHIEQTIFKFKDREQDFIKEFFNYDDSSIYELILNSCRGDESSKAFRIIDDLKNRRLFKRAFEKDAKDVVMKVMELEKDPSAFEKLEQDIAAKAGISSEFVIVHLESEEPGLKSFKPRKAAMKSDELPFLYLDKSGKIRSAEDRFSIMTRWEAPEKLFVFVPAEYQIIAKNACEQLIP